MNCRREKLQRIVDGVLDEIERDPGTTAGGRPSLIFEEARFVARSRWRRMEPAARAADIAALSDAIDRLCRVRDKMIRAASIDEPRRHERVSLKWLEAATGISKSRLPRILAGGSLPYGRRAG